MVELRELALLIRGEAYRASAPSYTDRLRRSTSRQVGDVIPGHVGQRPGAGCLTRRPQFDLARLGQLADTPHEGSVTDLPAEQVLSFGQHLPLRPVAGDPLSPNARGSSGSRGMPISRFFGLVVLDLDQRADFLQAQHRVVDLVGNALPTNDDAAPPVRTD